jgi:protein ImuB
VAEVAARLGDAGRRWHARARGQDPQPLVSDREDAPCEATLELEWPVEGLEPLSFVLARLLDPLCARLQREERGAAVIHTRLDLVTRTAHERALQIPAPISDARALRTLILLDLERHPPGAGIDRVTVRLDPAPGVRVQFSLFRRPLPAPDQVTALMARLTALMGEGRCGSPVLLDTHRPGRFAIAPFMPGGSREPHEDLGSDRTHGQPHAVLRRFRRPVPARVTLHEDQPVRLVAGGAGVGSGAVVACAGPWRTSGGWWRAHHPAGAWDREEWDLALASGLLCRVSRVRADDRWVIEGVWD